MTTSEVHEHGVTEGYVYVQDAAGAGTGVLSGGRPPGHSAAAT